MYGHSLNWHWRFWPSMSRLEDALDSKAPPFLSNSSSKVIAPILIVPNKVSHPRRRHAATTEQETRMTSITSRSSNKNTTIDVLRGSTRPIITNERRLPRTSRRTTTITPIMIRHLVAGLRVDSSIRASPLPTYLMDPHYPWRFCWALVTWHIAMG